MTNNQNFFISLSFAGQIHSAEIARDQFSEQQKPLYNNQ